MRISGPLDYLSLESSIDGQNSTPSIYSATAFPDSIQGNDESYTDSYSNQSVPSSDRTSEIQSYSSPNTSSSLSEEEVSLNEDIQENRKEDEKDAPVEDEPAKSTQEDSTTKPTGQKQSKKRSSSKKKKSSSMSSYSSKIGSQLREKANEYAKKGIEYAVLARTVAPGKYRSFTKRGQSWLQGSMGIAKRYMASTEKQLETLERLADLREANIITEEEFQEQKEKILSRL